MGLFVGKKRNKNYIEMDGKVFIFLFEMTAKQRMDGKI